MIAFINDYMLKAINVNEDDTYDFISIDGNSSMKYSNKNHINNFLEYIMEFYSISNFADIKISILIVNCNAEEEYVEYLHTAFKQAVRNDVINICTILPLVAGLKKKLNEECSTYLKVLDEYYHIQQNCEGYITCCCDKECNEGIEFTEENFIVLYNLSLTSFNDNEKELKLLSEKEKELESYEKQLAELASMLDNLKDENAKLKADLLKATETLDEIGEKFNKRNRSRVVCYLADNPTVVDEAIPNSDILREMLASQYRSAVIKSVPHGGLVSKGALICKVGFGKGLSSFLAGFLMGPHVTRQYMDSYELRAIQDGRVFYVYNEKRGVGKTSKILIIGDVDDTEKDVMEWHKNISKKSK